MSRWNCFEQRTVLGPLDSRIEGLAVYCEPRVEKSGTDTAEMKPDLVHLYVSTADGTMRLFEGNQDLKESKCMKPFHSSKKPATHLTAVARWNMLLSIIDGELVSHSLQLAPKEASSPSKAIESEHGEIYSKGVLLYAVQVESDLLCVCCKRAVLSLRYHQGAFSLLQFIPTGETARAVQWAGLNHICIGYSKDYWFIDLQSGAELKRPRIRTGVRKFPVMCHVKDIDASTGELLLCKDNEGYFVGFDGAPTREGSPVETIQQGKKNGKQNEFLICSEQPTTILACQPYVLAFLPRKVEVHLATSCSKLQEISIPGTLFAVTNATRDNCAVPTTPPSLAAFRQVDVYAANDKQVHLLSMTPLQALIDQVISPESESTHFEEALQLCQSASEPRWERWDESRGEQYNGLYVGAGLRAHELELLTASMHARYALFFFTEGGEPNFKTAMKHLEEAKKLGRLPLEFVTMLFRRSELFESENAATTLSLNLSDLRAELADLYNALLHSSLPSSEDPSASEVFPSKKDTPPCLALRFASEDLVAPAFVEEAVDLVYLSGNDLSNALLLLFLPYLLNYRQGLVGLVDLNSDRIAPGSHLASVVDIVQETLGIVDTLLLRAFVLCDAFSNARISAKTKPRPSMRESGSAQVSSVEMRALAAGMMEKKMKFLRGKNWCHVEDCEKLLLLYPEMWEELLWLYYGKGMHKSALEWLHKLEFSERAQREEETPPRSVHAKSSPYIQKSIEYLKYLGKAEKEIVFQFSRWIIETCVTEDALEIFVNPPARVEPIAPQDVIGFLEGIDAESIQAALEQPAKGAGKVLQQQSSDEDDDDEEQESNFPQPLAIAYLEYLLRKDKTAEASYHNQLVSLYISTISALLRSESIAGEARAKEIRSSLLKFLETSSCYSAADAAQALQNTDLYHEYALVLQRLGRHEKALGIYINKLHSVEEAERYCERSFDESDPNGKDVFLTFFKALIANGSLEKALQVGTSHMTKIDAQKALSELPSNLPLHALKPFLEAAVRHQSSMYHDTQVVRQLVRKEHITVKYTLSNLQRHYVVVSERTRCANPTCRRPIQADQALARLPTGAVVHYACLSVEDKL